MLIDGRETKCGDSREPVAANDSSLILFNGKIVCILLAHPAAHPFHPLLLFHIYVQLHFRCFRSQITVCFRSQITGRRIGGALDSWIGRNSRLATRLSTHFSSVGRSVDRPANRFDADKSKKQV